MQIEAISADKCSKRYQWLGLYPTGSKLLYELVKSVQFSFFFPAKWIVWSINFMSKFRQKLCISP